MPTRGYRKGISDTKRPTSRSIRTHITEAEFGFMKQESSSRSITLSKLLRALIHAHVTNSRVELPHPRATNAEALRELTRIGNNLNQLTRQANTGVVPIGAQELRRVLAAVLGAAQRL